MYINKEKILVDDGFAAGCLQSLEDENHLFLSALSQHLHGWLRREGGRGRRASVLADDFPLRRISLALGLLADSRERVLDNVL